MNENSVCSVWVKGKGMPSTALFPPPCWNVNVKTGVGAALGP